MKDTEREQLEARLENWAAWFSGWDNSRCKRTCGSAESRYVAPRVDEEQVQNRYVSTIDVADAEEVHQALQALPWKPTRQFLYLWCGNKMHRAVLVRLTKVPLAEIDEFLVRNLRALAVELARIERGRVHIIRRGQPIWAGVAKRK